MVELISDRVAVGRRYVRAVDLARDHGDPAALEGYVVTPSARDTLQRLVRGLAPTSTQRAFRVTGSYGSGKSSFGVMLAQLFAEDAMGGPARELATRAGLPMDDRPAYRPVVLVGRRTSLADELLRTIGNDAEDHGWRELVQCADELRAARTRGDRDIRQVLELLEKWGRRSRTDNGAGIILLIDEMGRFIEFAATNPALEDPSLFQQLAERCGGPGDHLAVVVFLHSHFTDYVAGLGGWFEGEWARSAERYEELAFHEPAEQALFLLAKALRPTVAHSRAVGAGMRVLYAEALSRGVYSTSDRALDKAAPNLFPLHPAVVACLSASSRRLGQNERSVFSFLQSHEPAGLQRHLASTEYGTGGIYRTDSLYDYLAGQGSLRFRSQDRERRWHLALDAMALAGDLEPLAQRVLRTLALLVTLEPLPGLGSTADTIAWCLGDSLETVQFSLDRLIERGLVHRRARGDYSLWSNSSVDLEGWLERAKAVVPAPRKIDIELMAGTSRRRMVAHRHYHQTGHQRTFIVTVGMDAPLPADVDGAILIVPLHPGEDEDRTRAEIIERSATAGPLRIYNLYRLIPSDLVSAHELALWTWVRENCAELRVDDLARGEVDRRIAAAQAGLEGLLTPLARGSHEIAGVWFQSGRELKVADRRALSALLSETCDRAFSEAPILRNELINRPMISKAVAAARTKLLELMITKSAESYLGLNGAPPERTIYLSLFLDSGLHREEGGDYAFREPPEDDPRNWRPTWDRIGQLLRTRESLRFDELMAELARPPYGLRAGPALPLLVAYILVNRRRIALMERGSFQPEFTSAHFMRLAKTPANFSLRAVTEEDERQEVLGAICNRVSIWKADERPEPFLTSVVEALYQWFNNLPDFSKRTTTVGPLAREVRSIMRKAQEPVTLLFQALPRTCGCMREDNTINTQEFAERLDIALCEITEAGPRLASLVRAAVLDAFSTRSVTDLRRQIELDYGPHLLLLREYRLRAFVERTLNASLEEPAWLDSVASLLLGKRLASWDDHSLDKFTFEVRELAQRLARWLALARVGHAGRLPVAGIHLTSSDGAERSFYIQRRPAAPGRVDAIKVVREALGNRPDADLILAELLVEITGSNTKENADG